VSITHGKNQNTNGKVVPHVLFLRTHRNRYTGAVRHERWNFPCISFKAHNIFGIPSLCSLATHVFNSTRELLQHNGIFRRKCEISRVLHRELLCTRESKNLHFFAPSFDSISTYLESPHLSVFLLVFMQPPKQHTIIRASIYFLIWHAKGT
jgi:hypothetical protein